MKPPIAIVGAGITGLTLARALYRQGFENLMIYDQEERPLSHASAKNSGVVHAGIYYNQSSLKAQLCQTGAQKLREYVQTHSLLWQQPGKLIVGTSHEDEGKLKSLHAQAIANGAKVRLVDRSEASELEPTISTSCPVALWSPETATTDPVAVLDQLRQELMDLGVGFDRLRIHSIDEKNRNLRSVDAQTVRFNYLFNCAGTSALKLAKTVDSTLPWVEVPFSGSYRRLTPNPNCFPRRLIYPVPDPSFPFLGIHITPGVHGEILVGPNAMPVIAKSWSPFLRMLAANFTDLWGFGLREAKTSTRSGMVREAQNLVPEISKDMVSARIVKRGVRAQLLERSNLRFVHDFLVHRTSHTCHLLNVVSPGFTSAFALADLLVDQLIHDTKM